MYFGVVSFFPRLHPPFPLFSFRFPPVSPCVAPPVSPRVAPPVSPRSQSIILSTCKQTEMRTELRVGCGQALVKLPGKGRKAGFSGPLKNEVSRVTPAWKCDGWLQSGLYFTKFQESASRAVLGGSRYPLYYENWVFSRNFDRGFASKPPPPCGTPRGGGW